MQCWENVPTEPHPSEFGIRKQPSPAFPVCSSASIQACPSRGSPSPREQRAGPYERVFCWAVSSPGRRHHRRRVSRCWAREDGFWGPIPPVCLGGQGRTWVLLLGGEGVGCNFRGSSQTLHLPCFPHLHSVFSGSM